MSEARGPPRTLLTPPPCPPPPLPPPCSAKGYLLNAGICLLASVDVRAVQAALERYRDLDVSFDGSRECKLLAVRAGGEGQGRGGAG